MIEKLSYSENNAIALLILIIILLNMKSDIRKIKYDAKLFLAILITTTIIIILDININIINGEKGFLIREINIALTTIYFILNPIPYILCSLYIDFYIHKSIRRVKKIAPIVAIPGIISILLCVFSLKNGGVFFIGENNLYRRGNLFLLNAALYYVYYIIVYTQLSHERKNMKNGELFSLLSFGMAPAIAGIIQTINTSKSYIWLAVSISCLIIYLNIQNNEINEDYLTGLYNRRQLDKYLKNSIRNHKKDESILLIMIDLDFFKEINDNYGHIEGDSALKHTANMLMDSFRSEDFISRYAGDEFVIIVKLKDEKYKEKIIDRLRRRFEEFNELDIKPYDICISIGWDIYNPDLSMNPEEFIMHIDNLMYREKSRVEMGIEFNCAKNVLNNL